MIPDKTLLNIYYRPSDPKSKSVAVHLPPLPKGCQIQNLAMSSLPDLKNEDWVVVVKLRSQLMFYRHKDLRWIDIGPMHAHESISPCSSVMYSKKDQRFYIPSPGGGYLCSFDQKLKEKDQLKYSLIWRQDIPQYMRYEWEEMNSFTRTDHMVESPTGEQFFISWYVYQNFVKQNIHIIYSRVLGKFLKFLYTPSHLNKHLITRTYL